MKTKELFVAVFCLFAAVMAASAGQSAAWPFIVIRHTGAINGEPETFGRLMECHRRHPGACDEFWFSAGGRGTPAAVAKSCEDFARYRPLCEEAGIALSYQQGLTLGHSEAHDGKPKPGEQPFPDDAWQVGQDGKPMHFLCPRSPDVIAYERAFAKAVIGTANPESYWLDDDLRLGISKPNGCFCRRCIAAFNAKTGGSWTRETLVARLFSKAAREPLRAAWLDFNAESLAAYAAAVRQAADELKSPCRLAYQSVWADTVYTASSYRPLLEALSGAGRKPVGIRPGAGYYMEAEPRGMVKKCLSVAREAERCRDYGDLVASVCYEQETYPRHVLHKSPGAIMTECALALASGCNSLSLYWFAADHPEPVEEYDRFVRTLAEARPYFERLAASVQRTRLGGVARFIGSAALEASGFDLRDEKDFDLACAGIPVTVAEAKPKVWYLTEKSRVALTDADRALLAKSGVVNVADVGKYPLASRRARLLDDLDKATGGTFPVRIDACRPLRILPRVREDGSLDSVTILNLSIGDTDELKVRVRNPVSEKAYWQGVKQGLSPLAVERGASADERVITIPNLIGWQVVTVFFERRQSPTEVVLGDFTRDDGGWRAAHHVKDVEVSSEGTSFTVTGNDPWLLGPKVSIPAAPAGAAKVRFTITCAPTSCGGAWEIYHDLEGKGYDERKKFALRACGSAPYTRFSVDMPVKGLSPANGSFRIDPPALAGERFTIKSFAAEIIRPLWSYRPETPQKLVLPADAIVIEGDGWRLSHDPSRMGAFRYESHGKIVEGNPGEPCVVLLKDGTPRQVDWASVKPSVERTRDGFTMTAATRDPEGRRWRMSRSFGKAEKGRALAIRTQYDCDETQALHVPYLTMFAERASNGHKRQAMLSGLEYLDDEPSSNTKDIRMPEANRLIPAIHRICAPFAALTDEKAWLAAEWTMPRRQEYSVVFDTPDRQFNSGGHLLAFWFPAVGEARPESELNLYGAEPYSGGSQTVVLRAGDGATVAAALAALVRRDNLPQRDKIDEVATLALLSHGWLDSKLRDGTKVSHAVGFSLNQASDAPALMRWLAAQIERRPAADAALVKRLREMASDMFAAVKPADIGRTCVSHIQRPVSPLLAGDVNAWIAARDERLRSGTKKLADGYRVWKASPGAKYDYGETLGAADCNGYTAMAMEEMLMDATWSGDESEIARALTALDKAIARYRGTVPRGAQPWEMPLHTPDIIASGLMVRCCALGYLLKPDVRYLKAARYWAYTGLSMVYLVPPPFEFPAGADPFGCYATCGVMGATHWDLVSWMGRPVQWCGLVYSAALYDYSRLCRPEETAFWRTIADGIVASGVRQSHPASEPDRQGLLPDSVYLDGQTRNPPAINPGDVQENLAEMLGSPYYALRAFPGKTPVLLHMAGDAAKLEREGNALACRIEAWPETESRLVLTRIDAPASVTLSGRQLAFAYDAARRIAVVTLPARAEGVFKVN